MKIIDGKVQKAVKVLIYGPEGIGKSTFASKFPRPLFVDTEDSTARMDVRRFEKPDSWEELLAQMSFVHQEPDVCQTLVIDTVDWAETLCAMHVCGRDKKAGIEEYGYGKGYVYLAEEFGRLMAVCDQIVNKGINVVLCCHAQMRKFEQPDEIGAYDRWELKLSKKIAPMVKEWADMVLFANYKTIVVNVDNQGAAKGKNKAQGGRRVMYTSHHPCWDAKNRFGLPEEMPFDYEGIREHVEQSAPVPKAEAPKAEAPKAEPTKSAPKTEPKAAPNALASAVQAAIDAPQKAVDVYGELPTALADMMRQAKVLPEEVRVVIAQKGIYPADTPWSVICSNDEFMNGWLMHPQVWPKIVDMVTINRGEDPF